MKKIISTLLITTAIFSLPTMVNAGDSVKITQSYGVNYEDSISDIRLTINAINEMRVKGTVSDDILIKLANQINGLTQLVGYSDNVDVNEVSALLNSAEMSINGVQNTNKSKVEVAIAVARAMMDIDTTSPTIESTDKKAPVYYAQDIGNLKGFSDIGNVAWAREAIEDMSTGNYKGLFSGTTSPNEQGLAQFSPNSQMTRAEFITVVTRALYSDQLANKPAVSGEFWYANNYDVALDNGLITELEYAFSGEVLNAAMTRQEMALILTRACEQMGEGTGTLVSSWKIADYDTVGDYYKDAVRTAYTKGLIAGKDTKGSFAPNDTLTRAEGATVLYRLVNESKRVKVTTTTGGSDSTVNQSQAITIYEGQVRYNRNAQEGDIFVKKDGTQITLKKGPNGILGEGQGVAPDVGLLGLSEKGGRFNYKVADYGNWYDSTGQHLQQNFYYVNRTTGEGHWAHELNKLAEAYPCPSYDGTQEGELSQDPLHLWVWEYGDWSYNFTF